MKTLNNVGIWALVFAVFLSVGCSKQREKRGEVRVGRGDNPVGITPGGTGGTGGTFQPQYGDVTGASNQAIVDLLSVTPDIEYQTPFSGVAMAGDVKVQGTTNVLAIGSGTAQVDTSSKFALYILDALAAEQGSIVIGFQPGVNNARATGQISNGGQVTLTFTDQYGSITMSGYYNQQTFQGQMSFQNSNGKAGSLGNFRVPTCGFFHCQ